MRRIHRSSEEVRLELTPLIDVVFLLLTFFVFSIVLMVRADALDIDLPEVGSGQAVRASATVTIAIDREGAILVNQVPTTLRDVPDRVADLRDDAPDASVLIAVDEAAPSGRLIELADTLNGAGLSRFSVIGRPSPPPSPPPSSPPAPSGEPDAATPP